MTQTSYREQLDIHLAVCRARKQGLCCSLCSDLAERAARVAAQQQKAEAA